MILEQFAYTMLFSKLSLPSVNMTRTLVLGLGSGVAPRILLDSRRVEAVITVEINQEIIDAYNAKYDKDPNEERHTILNGKASLGDYVGLGPFDFVLVDIVEDATPEQFQELLDTLLKLSLKGALSAASGVLIETIGNFKQERIFQFWLDDNFWTTEEVRPAMAENASGRASAMRIYHPPKE